MDSSSIAKFVVDKFGKGYYHKGLSDNIGQWFLWYQGYVEKFHKVKCSNGLTAPTRELYKLKMAKRVCEDWASAVLNEDVKIVVNASNNKSSVFVQGTKGSGGVLGSNNFSELISTNLELMFALGTSALVLDLNNVMVNKDNGDVAQSKDAKISISSYNAMQIVPLSVEGGKITEASFIRQFTSKKATYYLVSTHLKEEDGYVIYNDVLSDGYQSVSLDIGLLPVLRTKSEKPLFFIFKTNIVNNIDLDSPMGISVYSEAIDNLKACDIVYDSCVRDVITGQRIVMMNKNLLTTGDDGRPIVPQDVKQSYMQFFGDDAVRDVKEFIKEFNPDLQTENLDKELQNQLNMLSSKCGLGTKFYNFTIESGVTATEYIGERNDLYRNITKISKSITEVLKNMVSEILWIGYNILGANVDPNAKVVVEVSDGVVESDTEKRNQDRQDVKDKLMSRVEYRMKWYGETEEDAKKAIAKIDEADTGTET